MVIVVIVLLIWINGSSSRPNQTTVGSVNHPVAAAPHASATARHTTPSPVATATPSQHSTPTAVPSAAPTTAPAALPRSHASARRPASGSAMAPLTVLNNSRRAGLAAAVASEARHKGWPIRSVGNMQGVVPATTVYYAPGKHAAAMHLAHDFGSVQRVEPNRAGHIHGGALTLVVTRYWHL